MADDGPLQLSLFDEQDLAEITYPDFPGERLICLPQPRAGRRARPQARDLLAATEKLLAPLIARVEAGPAGGAARIGVKAGKVINKYKRQALRRHHHRCQPLRVSDGATRSP